MAATLELKATKEGADPDAVMSVQFSPDGTKIVSGGYSGTIKVWDAGALWASNHLSLVKADAPYAPPPSQHP